MSISNSPGILYAQSGGPTAVINASAASFISCAQQNFKCVYIAENGIAGILDGRIKSVTHLNQHNLMQLAQTPGAYFGSCRMKLPSVQDNKEIYQRIFHNLQQHNIQYLAYNGGNDSQDTVVKLDQAAKLFCYAVKIIGIPKTIDNDLQGTDISPGYGSAAKFVALQTQGLYYDIRAISHSSTAVFFLEVMGRNTGWIAAGAACSFTPQPDNILILTPEIPILEKHLMQTIQDNKKKFGFCIVVVSEGVTLTTYETVAESSLRDSFGHVRLGGIAQKLADLTRMETGLPTTYAKLAHTQRCSTFIASKQDLKFAEDTAKYAVTALHRGASGKMVSIQILGYQPFKYTCNIIDAVNTANHEKTIPQEYIQNNYYISQKFRQYITPLITGEAERFFNNGVLASLNCFKNA